MPFNMFPYSNLHNLNLDWVLNTVKTMAAAVEAAARTVETYAARLTQVETDVQEITPAAAGAVRHDVSQSLDTDNRRRAATNIHAVSYDSTILTNAEKQQARQNIGAAAAGDIPQPQAAVLYTEQELTSAQQQQARTNIGAASPGDIPQPQAAVLYTEQDLSSGQQSQARSNIEAASLSSVRELAQVDVYNIHIEETAADAFEITMGNLEDAEEALTHGAPILINLETQNYGLLRGVADFVVDANGYVYQINAYLTNLNAPGPGISTGYRIHITNNGTSDVLIVSSFEYKLMPSCTSSDRGKILTVASTGAPVWEDKGPLVLEFATENPYTVTTPIATIIAAFNAGRAVHLMHNNYTLPLNVVYNDGEDPALYFGASTGDPALAIYNSGSWSYNEA